MNKVNINEDTVVIGETGKVNCSNKPLLDLVKLSLLGFCPTQCGLEFDLYGEMGVYIAEVFDGNVVEHTLPIEKVSLKSKTANVLHWKTLVKEYRKKYNKSKESAMVYAEIEVFGKKAVLTEKGWECDQADLVKVLNLELNQPLEMYEPNPAAAFAERAAKLMGGKVISVISPPDNDGKEIVY
jgi:hypothetical protein